VNAKPSPSILSPPKIGRNAPLFRAAIPEKGFLPSNLYSIAEAQFYDESEARAVYADGRMVGFVLYGRDAESGSWKIYRLMVDRGFQRRGYGRAAMEAVLSELFDVRGCSGMFGSSRELSKRERRRPDAL